MNPMTPLKPKLFNWPDKISKWDWHDYSLEATSCQQDSTNCWKRQQSYYSSFMSKDLILAALQVIPLCRDLKELILEKIVDHIVSLEIQDIFLEDRTTESDREENYYSGYYSEDSG